MCPCLSQQPSAPGWPRIENDWQPHGTAINESFSCLTPASSTWETNTLCFRHCDLRQGEEELKLHEGSSSSFLHNLKSIYFPYISGLEGIFLKSYPHPLFYKWENWGDPKISISLTKILYIGLERKCKALFLPSVQPAALHHAEVSYKFSK